MSAAETFCTLTTFCVLKLALLLLTSHSRRHQRATIGVGRISRLVVYPVKSMKGIDVSFAECDSTGIIGDGCLPDRVWMVTTGNYKFVTARQQPKLTTIQPSLQANLLQLDAEGMDTVKVKWARTADNQVVQVATVWHDEIEVVDCGDEVSSWISSYLNKSAGTYRLVCHLSDRPKRRCDSGPTRWHKTAKADDMVTFQDGFPYMLMSESSVEDLNAKLKLASRNSVSMDNFRPNIVVSDAPPFDEDNWEELFISDATLTNIKPCERCVLTTVDPETGQKRGDNEPLVTLRRYRLLEPEFGNSPCFGINLVLTHPGRIHIGDQILAIRKTR